MTPMTGTDRCALAASGHAAEERDELAPLDAEHRPLLRSTETIALRRVGK
jgi:hypothetical protein